VSKGATYLMLSRWRLLSSPHTSTTGASRSSRFLLRSRCTMLGQVSETLLSSDATALATRSPSRITILSSPTWASLRRTLSKPFSSATLPEMIICRACSSAVPSSPPCGSWATYLSCSAAMKLCGESAGRVGRTNDAAVADFERPAAGECQRRPRRLRCEALDALTHR